MGVAVGGPKPRGMELASFGHTISCCGIGMTGGGAAQTGAGSGMTGAGFWRLFPQHVLKERELLLKIN